MFSGYYAIVKDKHGAELERYELDETDLIDLDTYAIRYAEGCALDFERGEGSGGDCDFSVTLTDEPDSVRIWGSAEYWFKEE
jgi:hypothetical protein